MSKNQSKEQTLLGAALSSGSACATIEQLAASLEEPEATPSAIREHLKSCGHCQSELAMLSAFVAGGNEDSNELRQVTAQLRARTRAMAESTLNTADSKSWWRRFLAVGWLAPVGLGMAAVLIVAGGMLNRKERLSQPDLKSAVPAGPEVYRSGEFALLNLSGDLAEPPATLRWESVSEASRYEVTLREVDRTELWKSQTEATHIEIPVSVRQKIVPAKTVFFEVIAYDTSGQKVGDTGLVHMRVVPH